MQAAVGMGSGRFDECSELDHIDMIITAGIELDLIPIHQQERGDRLSIPYCFAQI